VPGTTTMPERAAVAPGFRLGRAYAAESR